MTRLVALFALCAACGAPIAGAPEPGPPEGSAADSPVDVASALESPDAARARAILDEIGAAGPASGVRLQHELMRLGPDAWPVLVETLADAEARAAARQLAALALGEAHDLRACDALTSSWLARPESERTQVAIAVALGRCGVFGALLLVADSADDLGVRLKAAIALGLMRADGADEVVSRVRGDAPEELADFATLAAALLGDRDAADRLALSTPPLDTLTPDVAGFFALALYRGGIVRDDVPAAIRAAATGNPDPLVRQAALEVLTERRDRWALTALTTATNDPSRRVAAAASELLDRLGSAGESR